MIDGSHLGTSYGSTMRSFMTMCICVTLIFLNCFIINIFAQSENGKNETFSKKHKSLRFGFQHTMDCHDFQKAFVCIQKCLDLNFDIAYADKNCDCVCFHNKDKAQYTSPRNCTGAKWHSGAPTTSLPIWLKKLLPSDSDPVRVTKHKEKKSKGTTKKKNKKTKKMRGTMSKPIPHMEGHIDESLGNVTTTHKNLDIITNTLKIPTPIFTGDNINNLTTEHKDTDGITTKQKDIDDLATTDKNIDILESTHKNVDVPTITLKSDDIALTTHKNVDIVTELTTHA